MPLTGAGHYNDCAVADRSNSTPLIIIVAGVSFEEGASYLTSYLMVLPVTRRSLAFFERIRKGAPNPRLKRNICRILVELNEGFSWGLEYV